MKQPDSTIQRPRVSLALTFILLLAFEICATDLRAAEEFDWRRVDRYVPPDAARFFPDDAEGGKKLDALWRAADKDLKPDDEVLKVVRTGLRRTQVHRTEIVRWVGNRFIWNRKPQNPAAIEILYHAADFSGAGRDALGTRHYAVYFGLSVVEPKSPSILWTLADLCMAVDDPNDLDRVAWGARTQRSELLGYVRPHLQSTNEAVRQKARVVERIINGDLKAFAWSKEEATKRAKAKYSGELARIRETLTTGTSEERRTVLRLIEAERLALIMDDSFLPAFEAAGRDADAMNRRSVARTVGSQWIWEASTQNTNAIEMMIRLSDDPDAQVRYDAVYYGLSTVRKKSDALVRHLVALALRDHEPQYYRRIVWGLRNERESVERMIDSDSIQADPASLGQFRRDLAAKK